jgi:hypothetical protein
MPARRRIDPTSGRAAVRAWAAAPAAAGRDVVATAVRWSLEEMAERWPGHTCEVRVPPFGVVQCLAGPRHTRGTPPNVVETDAVSWLELATGRLDWAAAVGAGRVRASGERADLSDLLPLASGTDGSGPSPAGRVGP